MMRRQSVILVVAIVAIAEPKSTILQNSELAERIRPMRSINYDEYFSSTPDTLSEEDQHSYLNPYSSSDENTEDPNPDERYYRSVQKSEDTTTIKDEETTKKVNFLKLFLNHEPELLEKRSVDYLDKENEGKSEDNEEDLDTAANTVFRPLFAYRQLNERRRRLRNNNV